MEAVGAMRSGWARKAGGWGLLGMGIAGCVLPVIPGIPLLLAGLLVLARDYAWARRLLRGAKRWIVRMRRRRREQKERAAANARQGAAES